MLSASKTAAPANGKTYVEDVFSTYLYAGTGASQTINNGIDLAGKGGLAWFKSRGTTSPHYLMDSTRNGGGLAPLLSTNSADAQNASYTGTSFNSSGFSHIASSALNVSGFNYASWTFRKAAKFFDVVTWTGTGSARTIAHSLGVAPGCIIVKRTDTAADWAVYHRGQTSASYYTKLNLTDAQASDSTVWNGTAPTSGVFSVGTSALTNASGGTYVAYIFAHDTTADGIIQCGSYTGTGVSPGPEITLGWEPQWLLIKDVTAVNNWNLFDTMRGLTVDQTMAYLQPNNANAEGSTSTQAAPLPTGFQIKTTGTAVNASGRNYIYIAIRRGPMKTPTLGTSVFAPFATSLAVDTAITTNFPVDLMISGQRNSNNATDNWAFIDRLRGATASDNTSGTPQKRLKSTSTSTEDSPTYPYAYNWWNTGLVQGYGLADASQIYYTLRRAPGFFDVVCYTGTGAARTVNHNLGVAPELMIVKSRNLSPSWWAVYANALGNSKALYLNITDAPYTANEWNSTSPTSTAYSVSGNGNVNGGGYNYVAYLFASCPGVSKVGSYTGNGSSQTINCGFAAGARFVLIKRTDSTGDWYVWDTARGIIAGNDPHLSLNTIDAEVTSDDTIDPASSGFIVNQVAATNVNVNGASYIYLAIA